MRIFNRRLFCYPFLFLYEGEEITVGCDDAPADAGPRVSRRLAQHRGKTSPCPPEVNRHAGD